MNLPSNPAVGDQAMDLPKIVGIKLRYEYCLAHKCCCMECPQVFVLKDSCVSLTDEASHFFQTHALDILRAEAFCPVEAIEVQTNPPRSTRPEYPQIKEYQGKTVLQMLQFARDTPLKNLSYESLAKLQLYYEAEIQYLSQPTYFGVHELTSAREELRQIVDELAQRTE